MRNWINRHLRRRKGHDSAERHTPSAAELTDRTAEQVRQGYDATKEAFEKERADQKGYRHGSDQSAP